jgi:hypothetical protein
MIKNTCLHQVTSISFLYHKRRIFSSYYKALHQRLKTRNAAVADKAPLTSIPTDGAAEVVDPEDPEDVLETLEAVEPLTTIDGAGETVGASVVAITLTMANATMRRMESTLLNFIFWQYPWITLS